MGIWKTTVSKSRKFLRSKTPARFVKTISPMYVHGGDAISRGIADKRLKKLTPKKKRKKKKQKVRIVYVDRK